LVVPNCRLLLPQSCVNHHLELRELAALLTKDSSTVRWQWPHPLPFGILHQARSLLMDTFICNATSNQGQASNVRESFLFPITSSSFAYPPSHEMARLTRLSKGCSAMYVKAVPSGLSRACPLLKQCLGIEVSKIRRRGHSRDEVPREDYCHNRNRR
jgi:hypothetical protein